MPSLPYVTPSVLQTAQQWIACKARLKQDNQVDLVCGKTARHVVEHNPEVLPAGSKAGPHEAQSVHSDSTGYAGCEAHTPWSTKSIGSRLGQLEAATIL